jgi:hypothetical protein
LVAPELTAAPVRSGATGEVSLFTSRPHGHSVFQRSITGGISASVKPGRPSGMWSHGSFVSV